MSNLRQAAEQALEVLVRASSYYDTYAEIDALRAALAEPVQEPVWVCPDSAEHRYQKPGHCEDCGKTLVQVAEPVQERNFCPRCGKRTNDIHTCTPPLADGDNLSPTEPVAWMHNLIDDNIITHRPADIDRHPDRWTALYPDPKPCPTCVSLARAVMMDQMGSA